MQISVNKISSLFKKSKLKRISSFFVCILFFQSASAIEQIGRDKNLPVYLEWRGINSRLDHNYYQSKGLNTLIKVDGKLYMVSLNQADNIVIDLINEYRGAGMVCTDGREYLYITYCFYDGSIKTAKAF